MLTLRPNCENCNKSLPYDSTEAMICSFECTFCATCVAQVLHNVCPNCGGGFEKRPVRPQEGLDGNSIKNYPPTDRAVLKPVDHDKFKNTLANFKNINPEER